MSSGKLIERYRGDTHAIRVYLKDSSGDAVDITGATFKLTVNADENPTTDTKAFQVAGSIVGAAADGVVDFTPSAANTDITGTYYYDIEMTDIAGAVRTLQKGTILFIQDITKAS